MKMYRSLAQAACSLPLLSALAVPAGAQCFEWSAYEDFDSLSHYNFTTNVYSIAGFDDGSGPTLYVAGTFSGYEGIPSQGIVRWDGAQWSGVNPSLPGGFGSLTVFDDGTGPALYAVVHDGNATDVRRWDGVAWTALNFGALGGGEPHSLVLYDDGNGTALHASGEVSTAPSSNGIARWTGSAWVLVASGLPTTWLLTPHDDGAGQALYFSTGDTVGGTARIAKVTNTGYEYLGGYLDNIAYGLLSFDDGTGSALYVGGAFENELVPGTRPLRFLARWNGTSWVQVPGVPNRHIRSLHVYDDGNGSALYAGGGFDSTGAGPAAHVARWDGTSWSTLAGGPGFTLGTNFRVNTMASYDLGFGPTLWMGGDQIGGIPSWERLASYGSCFGTFCDASDGALATCPCSQSGGPDSGCEIAQQTGGVKLEVVARTSAPFNRATMSGTGFPANSTTPALVIRSATSEASPVVFGDGLRCLGLPVVRLGAATSISGTSLHTLGHGAGAGTGRAFYQLWFRNLPASFCDPVSGFNTSNGVSIDWR
jgi:hypothetical protein